MDASGRQHVVTVTVPLVGSLEAIKRPAAAYRLAHALGLHIVPPADALNMSAGILATMLESQREAVATLRGARVQNDGTVDVLVADRVTDEEAPDAVLIDLVGKPLTWDRWATSAVPLPDEDGVTLRDYVELLVLDYLAGNATRRSIRLSGRNLVADDNMSAFPPAGDRFSETPLNRLRGVRRFPRKLREALVGLDRQHVSSLFLSGGFENWLLSPRALIGLNERRAAILCLIEARVLERGADAVLTL